MASAKKPSQQPSLPFPEVEPEAQKRTARIIRDNIEAVQAKRSEANTLRKSA